MRQLPAAHRQQRSNGLYHPEWPRALEKAVERAHHAGHGERQDEPSVAILEGIEHHHGAHGEESKECECVQAASLKVR